MAKELHILLVEDDPGDVDLFREVLKEVNLRIHLATVEDGENAMLYLRRKPPYERVVRPQMIFLDLNLPRKDGREVLQEIKDDPTLLEIPVVVLSTSDAESDIRKSYRYGANCFLTKPVGLDAFSRMIRLVNEFWFTLSKLPPS